MTKFVLAITLAAISGLVVATHRDDTSLHASTEMTPAAQVNPTLSNPSAPATLPAAQNPAEDEPQCDATTVSEDAASCASGGWHATGTCCFTSPAPLERYTRGSTSKCCGACFMF